MWLVSSAGVELAVVLTCRITCGWYEAACGVRCVDVIGGEFRLSWSAHQSEASKSVEPRSVNGRG